MWNDNTTQDEAAEHILANHYTISRDGTSLGSSKEEKLRALQSAEDSAQNEEQSHIQHGEQEVATGGTQYHGFTFSGNANSTSPPNYLAETTTEFELIRPLEDKAEDAGFNFAYGFGDKIPKSAPNQPNSLMHLLQEKIKVLQNENKRLWQQQKREDASYKVLYCVSDRIYLEKPYWDMSGEGFKLKANSPLLYHDACIQYNLFTFVVYRYYSMDEWAEAESTDGLHRTEFQIQPPQKGS